MSHRIGKLKQPKASSFPFQVFCDDHNLQPFSSEKGVSQPHATENLTMADFDLSKEHLEGLGRRDLQALAKKHGVRANIRSHEIIRCLIKMNDENADTSSINSGMKKTQVKNNLTKKRALATIPSVNEAKVVAIEMQASEKAEPKKSKLLLPTVSQKNICAETSPHNGSGEKPLVSEAFRIGVTDVESKGFIEKSVARSKTKMDCIPKKTVSEDSNQGLSDTKGVSIPTESLHCISDVEMGANDYASEYEESPVRKTIGPRALNFQSLIEQTNQISAEELESNEVENEELNKFDKLNHEMLNKRQEIEEAKKKQAELQSRLEETRRRAEQEREKLKLEQEDFERRMAEECEKVVAEQEKSHMKLTVEALKLGLEMEKENIPPTESIRPDCPGFHSARKAGKQGKVSNSKKGKSFGGLSFRDKNVNHRRDDDADNSGGGILQK